MSYPLPKVNSSLLLVPRPRILPPRVRTGIRPGRHFRWHRLLLKQAPDAKHVIGIRSPRCNLSSICAHDVARARPTARVSELCVSASSYFRVSLAGKVIRALLRPSLKSGSCGGSTVVITTGLGPSGRGQRRDRAGHGRQERDVRHTRRPNTPIASRLVCGRFPRRAEDAKSNVIPKKQKRARCA